MNQHRTTMWEAVAAEGKLERLLGWAVEFAESDLLAADSNCTVQIYSSADDRVVIIATGSLTAPQIPKPPVELLQRTPHQWHFRSWGFEFNSPAALTADVKAASALNLPCTPSQTR